MTLSDLQQLAVLGAGGFGKVTLVKHKAGAAASAYYALKQMTKAYIKAQGLVRHVHREKQVGAGGMLDVMEAKGRRWGAGEGPWRGLTGGKRPRPVGSYLGGPLRAHVGRSHARACPPSTPACALACALPGHA